MKSKKATHFNGIVLFWRNHITVFDRNTVSSVLTGNKESRIVPSKSAREIISNQYTSFRIRTASTTITVIIEITSFYGSSMSWVYYSRASIGICT